MASQIKVDTITDAAGTGAPTFNNGVRLDDDQTAGGKTLLVYYREESNGSTTWTFNNSAATASSTMFIVRTGSVVTIRLPPTQGTSNGSDTLLTSAAGAIPAWARPTNGTLYQRIAVKAGSAENTNGLIEISTAGTAIIRLVASVAFTAGTTGSDGTNYLTYHIV